MFTCGNNALVVGDGTAIVKCGMPIDNVKFNGAVYTYECVIVAIEFLLFERQTRKENKSLVHVAQNYNDKELTFTLLHCLKRSLFETSG
jgi:hypothetical protein